MISLYKNFNGDFVLMFQQILPIIIKEIYNNKWREIKCWAGQKSSTYLK